MTETVLRQIVQRAVSDAAFRGQLRTDPAKALAGISLTTEESSALSSGDPTRLTALGVDQRMSKAFSAGLFSEASKLVIGDPDLSNSGTLTDEPTAGQRSAIAGDPVVAAAAAFGSPAHTATDYQLRMTESTIADDSASVSGSPAHTATGYQLQMTEGTIDTSSALEPSYTDATTRLIQSAEGNIDTGAVVDPSTDAPTDVQVGDVHPSAF